MAFCDNWFLADMYGVDFELQIAAPALDSKR